MKSLSGAHIFLLENIFSVEKGQSIDHSQGNIKFSRYFSFMIKYLIMLLRRDSTSSATGFRKNTFVQSSM